jgi:hypothetical protein
MKDQGRSGTPVAAPSRVDTVDAGGGALGTTTVATDGMLADVLREVEDAMRAQPAPGGPVDGPLLAVHLLGAFGGPPPYQPSRILAGGELAVIFAFLFANPTVDIANGFAIPPTVQLSNRTYRVGMEQINLTDVTKRPDMHKQDTFGAPADAVTTLADEPGSRSTRDGRGR